MDRLIDTETTRFLKEKNIPLVETAVYTRLVVDLIPIKAVHERLRIFMGGDRMESVRETTTRTADLNTCKLHMNGVVSTPGAIFAGGDVNDFLPKYTTEEKDIWKGESKVHTGGNNQETSVRKIH